MGEAGFILGFFSCMTMIVVLFVLAYALHLTRRHVEVRMFRLPDFMERDQIQVLVEAGYTVDSVRAVNGNRLIDITAHRIV